MSPTLLTGPAILTASESPSEKGSAVEVVRGIIERNFCEWVTTEEKVTRGVRELKRPSEAQVYLVRQALLTILDEIASCSDATERFENVYNGRRLNDGETYYEGVAKYAMLLLLWKALEEQREVSTVELGTLIGRTPKARARLLKRTRKYFPLFTEFESDKILERKNRIKEKLVDLMEKTRQEHLKMDREHDVPMMEYYRKIITILINLVAEIFGESVSRETDMSKPDCLRRSEDGRIDPNNIRFIQIYLTQFGLKVWGKGGSDHACRIDPLPDPDSFISQLLREVKEIEGS